ncbi:MAG: class I SAM-dependent methyltransferase [Thermoanaerobaculia bacterium]
MLGKKDCYLGWWASPECEAHRWKLISGGAEDTEPTVSHWYRYLEGRFPKALDGDRWLSLCCGRGDLERFYASRSKFTTCLAVDISEAQLRIARKAAKRAHISNVYYSQRDLNSAEFADDHFDFVIAQGALHHIRDLNILLDGVSRALKPGGYFVMHEYLGPIRWKLSKSEISLVNQAMEMIPDAFRPSLKASRYWCLRAYDMRYDSPLRRAAKAAYYEAIMLRDKLRGEKQLFRTYRSYDAGFFESYLRDDPSESVSGDNIVPALEKYFEIVDIRPIGGTIISWILDFDWGFDLEDPAFLGIVRQLLSFEFDVITGKQAPSHYASIVVRNKN